jgi:A nuclease family of the HNH/ENDO VII superfamily with conserved AHH
MREFRGMTGVGVRPEFQLHHLLPVGVFGHRNFSTSFQLLRADGFDPRFYSVNGLFLPATESAAMLWKMPMHRGPHRQYNELVAARVDTILLEMQRRCYIMSARYEAVERLNLLIATLRRILTGGRTFLRLSSRDPLHSHAHFCDIDAACERLWLVTK